MDVSGPGTYTHFKQRIFIVKKTKYNPHNRYRQAPDIDWPAPTAKRFSFNVDQHERAAFLNGKQTNINGITVTQHSSTETI